MQGYAWHYLIAVPIDYIIIAYNYIYGFSLFADARVKSAPLEGKNPGACALSSTMVWCLPGGSSCCNPPYIHFIPLIGLLIILVSFLHLVYHAAILLPRRQVLIQNDHVPTPSPRTYCSESRLHRARPSRTLNGVFKKPQVDAQMAVTTSHCHLCIKPHASAVGTSASTGCYFKPASSLGPVIYGAPWPRS